MGWHTRHGPPPWGGPIAGTALNIMRRASFSPGLSQSDEEWFVKELLGLGSVNVPSLQAPESRGDSGAPPPEDHLGSADPHPEGGHGSVDPRPEDRRLEPGRWRSGLRE